MRIAESWISPRFRVVIYTLDAHWYIEFEAGPMKQGYKISKEEFPSVDAVKKFLSDTFLEDVYQKFNAMFLSLKAAREASKTSE